VRRRLRHGGAHVGRGSGGGRAQRQRRGRRHGDGSADGVGMARWAKLQHTGLARRARQGCGRCGTASVSLTCEATNEPSHYSDTPPIKFRCSTEEIKVLRWPLHDEKRHSDTTPNIPVDLELPKRHRGEAGTSHPTREQELRGPVNLQWNTGTDVLN
jgi:hypothetical protein